MTTTVVATNGFNVPPAQPGTERGNPPIDGGQPNLPPLNPVPGFNPPPLPANGITSQTQPAAQPAAVPQAQPQTQPAQQPAAPAVPELEELTGVPTQDLRNFDVGQIDDPVIKSMAEVLLTTSPDIDLDRALANALKYGNPDFVDVAYLREKGGKSADQLISIAKGLVQSIEAKASAQQQSIFDLAGGEQQWDLAVAAFNQHAPAEQRAVIVHMLNSGKAEWINSAARSIVAISKQTGAVPNPAALVQTGQAGLSNAQALSKVQFQEELNKLNKNAPDYVAQSNQLFARRQLGKNSGL